MKVICIDFDKGISKPCLHYTGNGYCSLPTRFSCIEYIRRKNPQLSPSLLSTFSCKRAYYYEYVLGLKPKLLNKTMLCGSIIHAEVQYIHTQNEKFKNISESLLVKGYDAFEDTMIEDWLKIKAVTDIYKKLYGETTGKCEIPVRSDDSRYNLKGVIDFIDSIGRIYDFKYTSRPDNYTIFTTEIQAGLYLLLTNSSSIIFRLITKPLQQKKTSEHNDEFENRIREDIARRPGHYFKDVTFYKPEYNFDALENYLEVITEDIKELVGLGIEHYYQNRKVCFAPSACDYLPICEAKGLIPEDAYIKRDIKEYYE